jgi:release factor glutamine methyltransferase
VARREEGEPLAWITGVVDFCGCRVQVDVGVYVPRPQSEELARRGARLLPAGGRAADICTGSGAIATYLSSAVPSAEVVGVDLDFTALVCARRNGVEAVRGDLGEPLRPHAFDLVTAVAPYVPTEEIATLPRDVQRHEPRRALDGGEDGLELVRRIVSSAPSLLRGSGWLLLELGGDQDEQLFPALATAGFESVTGWRDEDGDLRGLAARLARSG